MPECTGEGSGGPKKKTNSWEGSKAAAPFPLKSYDRCSTGSRLGASVHLCAYSPWECGNAGEAQTNSGFLASWGAAKSGPGSTAAKGSPSKEHKSTQPQSKAGRGPCPVLPVQPSPAPSFPRAEKCPNFLQFYLCFPAPHGSKTPDHGARRSRQVGRMQGLVLTWGMGSRASATCLCPSVLIPGEGEQQQVPDFSHRVYCLVMNSPHQQARTGVMVHEYISGVVTQTEICTAFVQRKK